MTHQCVQSVLNTSRVLASRLTIFRTSPLNGGISRGLVASVLCTS